VRKTSAWASRSVVALFRLYDDRSIFTGGLTGGRPTATGFVEQGPDGEDTCL
jgi:hypothetical protein